MQKSLQLSTDIKHAMKVIIKTIYFKLLLFGQLFVCMLANKYFDTEVRRPLATLYKNVSKKIKTKYLG